MTVRYVDSQIERLPETQTVRQAENQTVRESDRQIVKQLILHSKTFRQSDIQTKSISVKHSNSQTVI